MDFKVEKKEKELGIRRNDGASPSFQKDPLETLESPFDKSLAEFIPAKKIS